MSKISHISWGGYDKGFYGIVIIKDTINKQELIDLCDASIPWEIGILHSYTSR